MNNIQKIEKRVLEAMVDGLEELANILVTSGGPEKDTGKQIGNAISMLNTMSGLYMQNCSVPEKEFKYVAEKMLKTVYNLMTLMPGFMDQFDIKEPKFE